MYLKYLVQCAAYVYGSGKCQFLLVQWTNENTEWLAIESSLLFFTYFANVFQNRQSLMNSH